MWRTACFNIAPDLMGITFIGSAFTEAFPESVDKNPVPLAVEQLCGMAAALKSI